MAKNVTKLKHRFPLKQVRSFLSTLPSYYPEIILLFVCLILAYANFTPGTILTGWDNLHTEFNPGNDIRRSFFGVWQEYRATGMLLGQAQPADLLRQLFVLLLTSLHLPINAVRYFLVFSSLVIGSIGTVTFLKHFLKRSYDVSTIKLVALFGGLFYLLNLSTVQTFFIPFESFYIFYAFFPWLIFSYVYFLYHHGRKGFWPLILTNLFITPAFFVQTLYLVVFISLLPFSLEYFLAVPKIRNLGPILKGLSPTLFLNLFWLLPVAFFVITGTGNVTTARINLISSPETYQRNLQFSGLNDIALMKSYLFNYLDLGPNGQFDYLLSVWRNHLNTPVISLIGYTFFAIIILGFVVSIKKKIVHIRGIIGITLLCLFFLMGGGLLINSHLPLIGELFRAPFTKFNIPLSFTFSIFFAIGCIYIIDLFAFLHSELTVYLTAFTLSILLFMYISPAFAGQLISPSMRQTIPSEYFELFEYFKTQDQNTRIATFPQSTFWGWTYADFGYRGSGFLWFGLHQPTLDRAFDVWHQTSEDYYEEMNAALYSADLGKIEYLTNKYDLGWFILDRHVITPDSSQDDNLARLVKMLESSKNFKLVKNFNDSLLVYQTTKTSSTDSYISLGNITSNYPYSNLNLRPNNDWVATISGVFSPSIKIAEADNTLSIPSLTTTESLLPYRIYYQKQNGSLNIKATPLLPQIVINGKIQKNQPDSLYFSVPVTNSTSLILQIDKQFYEIELPSEFSDFAEFTELADQYLPAQKSFKIKAYDGSLGTILDVESALKDTKPYQCYTNKPDRKIEKIVTQNSLSLLGTDVVACLSVPLPKLPEDGIISYSFSYFSPTLTLANANITNSKLGGTNSTQPLPPQKTTSRVRLFSEITFEPQQFNLILEANDTKSVQETNFSKIELFFHPLVFATSIQIPNLPESSLKLSAGDQMSVFIPNTNSSFDITQNPKNNQLFPENKNCDQFNTGLYKKTVTANGFLYESQNAIVCDHLDLRHLPHSLGYLLNFDYQYQTGLATNICLENHTTKRCDVYEKLAIQSTPQNLIQPISNSDETDGYTMNLFTQSIGNIKSTSLIKSFSIKPLSLNFLKSIKVVRSAITPTDSHLMVNHPAEFLYQVEVNTNEKTALNLYQSRSPYWVALTQPENKLLKPIQNNSWFNSWEIPSGKSSLQIIYLPQLLEFFGLILFILFLLIALLLTLHHRHVKIKKHEVS